MGVREQARAERLDLLEVTQASHGELFGRVRSPARIREM
jgi:hypothetical protein